MMTKRFETLDAFRGLCALSIVVFHMHWVGSVTELNFFINSNLFVEFFFVLSGFVLAHGYGFKDNLNFETFMKARFFRLYPLHFAMFVFVFALQLTLFLSDMPLSNGDRSFTGWYALDEILPNLLLIQGWTPYTEKFSFNTPSWSISVEFYVYALLFVTIVAFKRYQALAWLAIALAAGLLLYHGTELLIVRALKGLICFFGGACMYVLYKKISHLNLPFLLATAIEIALLVAVVLTVQSELVYRSAIATSLFFLTILFFAFESGYISTLLKLRLFQHMGTLSYSIYMTHYVIILYIEAAFKLLRDFTAYDAIVVVGDKIHLTLGNEMINNIAVIIIVGITIVISNLTYKYIELNGKKLNNRRFS